MNLLQIFTQITLTSLLLGNIEILMITYLFRSKMCVYSTLVWYNRPSKFTGVLGFIQLLLENPIFKSLEIFTGYGEHAAHLNNQFAYNFKVQKLSPKDANYEILELILLILTVCPSNYSIFLLIHMKTKQRIHNESSMIT